MSAWLINIVNGMRISFVRRVWLKYRGVIIFAMSTVLSVILILALITIATINLNMMIVHAEDLPYCAAGEGKNGVSVKICSVDKEICEENAKEHEISASCK